MSLRKLATVAVWIAIPGGLAAFLAWYAFRRCTALWREPIASQVARGVQSPRPAAFTRRIGQGRSVPPPAPDHQREHDAAGGVDPPRDRADQGFGQIGHDVP